MQKDKSITHVREKPVRVGRGEELTQCLGIVHSCGAEVLSGATTRALIPVRVPTSANFSNN